MLTLYSNSPLLFLLFVNNFDFQYFFFLGFLTLFQLTFFVFPLTLRFSGLWVGHFLCSHHDFLGLDKSGGDWGFPLTSYCFNWHQKIKNKKRLVNLGFSKICCSQEWILLMWRVWFQSSKEGGTEESCWGCSQGWRLSMWWVWFRSSKEGGTEESCGGCSQGWRLSMWLV